MTLQQTFQANAASSRQRNLNSVQRTLRTMIWLVLFVALAALALLLFLGLMAAGAETGGWLALFIGGFLSLALPGLITRCLYVIPEFERVVVLKLGKFVAVRGPGMFWVVPYPPFYQSVAADLDIRVQTRAITAAQTLTKDNVPVSCEAVIFWRVEDPRTAALEVANYSEAVFQAANSALKDTIGSLELSELLGEREMLSSQLKVIIDSAASRFGVDVSSVEITDIHVPEDLIQELSVLAQSRRSAQAKLAEADVERQIAEKLQQAAEAMGSSAMELYRLNVLERIGREEGSQIVIYGLNGGNAAFEENLAANAAGALVQRPAAEGRPADRSQPSGPPPVFEP
jgi:regulator of protease activity HflC (stomatin/prohibitin superfamily)